MLLRTLKFIYNHPFNSQNKIGGVLRFVKWQVSSRLSPYPIVYPYTENSKIIMWRGLAGATGNLYCGLLEFDDMGFLLHFLRDTDLFIDIGANIGTYTILASGEVGANTIAIEPIPSTFKNLNENISVNQIHEKVNALNIGLGAKEGVIKFTQSLDAVNHVATEDEKDTIDVQVDTLDKVISKQTPVLLKIDVEGFETEVLNGAQSMLQSEKLKAIIIELNGSGNRYGYDENLIHSNLINLGFQPYNYNPKERTLKQLSSYGNHNTIYIRDIEFVKQRVESARKIKIGSSEQSI